MDPSFGIDRYHVTALTHRHHPILIPSALEGISMFLKRAVPMLLSMRYIFVLLVIIGWEFGIVWARIGILYALMPSSY